MYPTLCLLGAGVWRWRDDSWKLSKFVIYCFVAAQITLLTFGILSIFLISVLAGIMWIGNYIMVSCMVFLLGKWAMNGFSLPRKWKFAAIFLVGIEVAISLIASIYQNSTGDVQASIRCVRESVGYE